jgi:transketolase
MSTQRDIFINELFNYAKTDKDVIMISVDMGAPALDQWREKLPEQFIAAGISEQNAINVAAGLSAEGKKVYVYFMASWVARCFEQIRYSCCMGDNPITIIGNGIGLGYAPAGPAHSPTEDIAYMRSLNHIEIITPANLNFIKSLVDLTYNVPKLRYIRLERSIAKQAESFYKDINENTIKNGLSLIKPGLSEYTDRPKVAIISSGYMLGRAIDVSNKLLELDGRIENCVFDLWKIKPLNVDYFNLLLNGFTHIITLEEQSLDGGFGSAIYECLLDNQIFIKTLRIGLPSRFLFKNGNREQLLNTNGLSVESIYNQIKTFVK